jgi:hypothetical protein
MTLKAPNINDIEQIKKPSKEQLQEKYRPMVVAKYLFNSAVACIYSGR